MQVNYCYASKGDNTITINCDLDVIRKIIRVLEDESYDCIEKYDYDGCKKLLDMREKIQQEVKLLEADSDN